MFPTDECHPRSGEIDEMPSNRRRFRAITLLPPYPHSKPVSEWRRRSSRGARASSPPSSETVTAQPSVVRRPV